jgi:pyruvate dehydrogenase E1 component alpha subunit
MDMKSFVAEWYGKSTGCCGGRSGYHNSDLKIGLPGLGGTLGSCFPIATGLALSIKYSHTDQVVLGFFGDGAGGRGLLHEAFLMSANWNLPVVWICENNGMAVSTPSNLVYPMQDVVDLAAGYHMPGVLVDGQDVIAVYDATKEAVAHVRNDEGPALIECKTFRYKPHAEGLPDSRSPEILAEMREHDPIVLFENKLRAKGILDDALIAQIQQEAVDEVEEAEQFADESPAIDPATMYEGLYA